MPFVLDASVTLTWLFADEAEPATDELLQSLRTTRAVVPALWAYEVTNAVVTAVRRKRITHAHARAATDLLDSLPVDIAPTPALATLLSLADEARLSTYDAAYLLLAMQESIPLATLDGRLRSAAEERDVAVIPAPHT